MWARLQGVGISVRADTALPWPPPLLHKTSQPALSPGLESVSAATCQIKTKRNKNRTKNSKKRKKTTCPSRLPPCVTTHPSPPSLLLFLCLIADEMWPVGKTRHYISFRQSNAACLSSQPCLPFCLLPAASQGHSSSVQSGFLCCSTLRYQGLGTKCGSSLAAAAAINWWWVTLVDAVSFPLSVACSSLMSSLLVCPSLKVTSLPTSCRGKVDCSPVEDDKMSAILDQNKKLWGVNIQSEELLLKRLHSTTHTGYWNENTFLPC